MATHLNYLCMLVIHQSILLIPGWSKGRTVDFGSADLGSNPSPGASFLQEDRLFEYCMGALARVRIWFSREWLLGILGLNLSIWADHMKECAFRA